MVDFNTWEFDYDGWTMGEDALYMQTLEYAHKLDEAACREIIEQINLLMRIPKRPDGRNGGAET